MVNRVLIGGVEAGLRAGGDLVPVGFLKTLPRSLLPTVRWLAQRDALNQDAVLLASPGEVCRARHAAFAFAELVNSEAYYVGISADTTESELRQRRELDPGKGSYWSDSAPVRAAVSGGLLVIDGLERAERNVLPTLNNLLENREMSLDDGRLLRSASSSSATRASSSVIEDVPRSFRVVAVASPCPPYKGRALDPPLRSRLQSRLVPPMSVDEIAAADAGGLGDEQRQKLVDAAATLLKFEADDIRRRRFSTADKGRSYFFGLSTQNLARAAKIATHEDTGLDVLRKVYPPLSLPALRSSTSAEIERMVGGTHAALGGSSGVLLSTGDRPLWLSAKQRVVFEAAKRDLDNGRRVLLVGTRGGGKSAIAQALIGNQRYFRLACHEDMTSRDLLQRRHIDDTKGSVWRDAPLIEAARTEAACVVDGIHRLPTGVFVAGLGRALQDQLVDLPDGTRLSLPDTCRVICLAEATTTNAKWLTPDLAAMFSTYVLPDWGDSEQDVVDALENLTPDFKNIKELARVVCLSHKEDEETTRLSTRAVLRLARSGQISSLRSQVREALMAQFLPLRLSDQIDSWFDEFEDGAQNDQKTLRQSVRRCGDSVMVVDDNDGDELCSLPVHEDKAAPELVPRLGDAYVPSAAAEAGVARLAQLFSRGERFVAIIGNQGVGKNVCVDRFLELINAEREYQQLHRDTTLTTLTTTPTVTSGGKVEYVDAALVRAAMHGRVAVLDEADKAPVDVVVSLKGLVADGVLALSDGRVLRRGETIHDDFRLIVLANRPGHPFHGHPFFKTCGDAFATFSIENPDLESETVLLSNVAPGLDGKTRRRLASCFAELRAHFEEGTIDYPYSMRECLSVARHMNRYPSDGVVPALSNVLSHDAYASHLSLVADVFEAHGFEGVRDAFIDQDDDTKGQQDDIEVAYTYSKEAGGVDGNGGASIPRTQLGNPKFGKVDPTQSPHVGGNTWAGGSGGSDTAGLGGRGGPFRLWDGKNMPHQVSDEHKAQVSAEAKRVAREQARAAHERRLAEIDKMSEDEWEMYENMLERIGPHVAGLRLALEAARDKKKDKRAWLKRRSDGDVDDDRVVDGVAGDKLVYKRRGKTENVNDDDDAEEAKRSLLFLVDVSGSMYRFQMVDGRLARLLEASMLIMEALEGLDHKYEYSIRGHSGDSNCVEFVRWNKPPKNRGDRLKVLQRMVAHAQFCDSGDTTISATHRAVEDVVVRRSRGDEATRGLVVALSDANFRRYGLDPLDWAVALSRDEDSVDGYALMIGSLGDEAARVSAALPRGRGHVAGSSEDIPIILKKVLRHAGVLQDDSSI